MVLTSPRCICYCISFTHVLPHECYRCSSVPLSIRPYSDNVIKTYQHRTQGYMDGLGVTRVVVVSYFILVWYSEIRELCIAIYCELQSKHNSVCHGGISCA